MSQGGRTWGINFTGVSHRSKVQHSASARFESEDEEEIFGTLAGVPPEDFEKVVGDPLVAALESALSGGES